MIQGKKIFITGGAGFMGSKLVEKYVENNEIIVFDTFDRDALSKTPVASHSNLTVINGDVLDRDALVESAIGSNIFIHAAAVAGIDNTVKDPVKTMSINMIGTSNALEAATNTSKTIERFMDFSTSEIFGSRAYQVDESNSAVTGAVGEARWTYAVSKLAGEHLTHAYHRQHSLPTVTIRPFNIYGPGQIGEGAISVMIRRALKNEDIYIFGDGSQIRAWCYIDDMINALDRSLWMKQAIGESLNIGNARAVTTIYGLAQIICRVTNSSSKIIFKDALSADIELRVPSVEKAKKIINFSANIDLEDGLIETAKWIKANINELSELPEIFTK